MASNAHSVLLSEIEAAVKILRNSEYIKAMNELEALWRVLFDRQKDSVVVPLTELFAHRKSFETIVKSIIAPGLQRVNQVYTDYLDHVYSVSAHAINYGHRTYLYNIHYEQLPGPNYQSSWSIRPEYYETCKPNLYEQLAMILVGKYVHIENEITGVV
jgi:hypothetical protein